MLKKLLLLVSLIPMLSHAGEITYPGEAWIKYGHSVHQDETDYDRGLLFLNVLQGVEYNHYMLYTGINSYRPNRYSFDNSDSYIQLGIKHKIPLGLDLGVERQFVDNGINRTVLFFEYFKTWDLKK